MQIVPLSEAKIEDIAHVLAAGGIVVMPTETVYITAVDATNLKAVERLVEYKNRPFGKPFSVAVTDLAMAEKYVVVNETARNLYKTFLPGPVTVVSVGRHTVAPGVESELGSLGIRIPDYKLVLDLVAHVQRPITATSANASYQKRPYKISDIFENISEKQKQLIDLVIDAGELPHNEPSTVIDTTLDEPAVLRQGDIKLKDEIELLSRSEENTKNVAKELWQKYESYFEKRPIVFALEGPMGAGKTQFTKGLAKAMGLKEEDIISPTFILHEEHGVLNHIDAWRMEKSQELEELNFAKMLTDKSVIAIEWADRVADVIKLHQDQAVVIWVKISYGKNPNDRLITWGVA